MSVSTCGGLIHGGGVIFGGGLIVGGLRYSTFYTSPRRILVFLTIIKIDKEIFKSFLTTLLQYAVPLCTIKVHVVRCQTFY